MTRSEILEAIHAVLRDHMQHSHLEAFAPEARLNEDLYLDSVLMLHLFLNLEMEFGLPAPDEVIAGEGFSTVADLVELLAADGECSDASAAVASQPSEGVHGEDYIDIKVHCFVSCVCAALKQSPGIDHRPFYFGVWDADFAISDRWGLLYHAPSISHDFFRDWYRRLYGVEVVEWYDPGRSKQDNLLVLLHLLERRRSTEYVMVMLDMYHLPERENKFNQNPFPHYLMLETTDDPAIWRVLDPDFRWEGQIEKDRVVNAILQPTVGGGYVFDRAQIREPRDADLKAYFEACFRPDRNALIEGTRLIIRAHAAGQDGTTLGELATALRELPVISIRKYAYEHGFAFFWRALKLPDSEFQIWCDEIDDLAQSFKTLHYAVLKLSQTQNRDLLRDVETSLDRLDALEHRIKRRLSAVFDLWCAQRSLTDFPRSERMRAMA
ncbi:DUF6005 family protein [Flaviflagellibacter deserti]|uniref:DUF6005 family protein n=1 Tax=Flaviflagellibacter deserti TaxID=2267266 RepID=A0ABV9YWY5_9HYPH